MLEGTKDPKEG